MGKEGKMWETAKKKKTCPCICFYLLSAFPPSPHLPSFPYSLLPVLGTYPDTKFVYLLNSRLMTNCRELVMLYQYLF